MPCLIQREVDLRAANSLRLPAQAEYFALINDAQDLPEALQFAREQQLAVTLLGEGTNLVLGNKLPGLALRMANQGLRFEEQQLTVAAGENWHQVVLHSLEKGLYGLENLALIPGTMGAAPMQNIGAYGVELADLLHHLLALNRHTMELVRFNQEDCGFGYRTSLFKTSEKDNWIITEVSLALSKVPSPQLGYKGLAAKLDDMGLAPEPASIAQAVMALRQQKLPDPAKEPNAGSFFKNPVLPPATAEAWRQAFPSAPVYAVQGELRVPGAWLIEQAGLKGASQGDAAISPRHALVVVNRGQATAADIEALAARVRRTVHDQFGLWLEQEPQGYGSI